MKAQVEAQTRSDQVRQKWNEDTIATDEINGIGAESTTIVVFP